MSIRLSDGASNTIFLQNPVIGNSKVTDKRQHVGRAASGKRYCYTKGAESSFITVRWENLREDEMNDLLWFFRDVARGCAEEFYYTDHKGVIRKCQFTHPELYSREVGDKAASIGDYIVQGDVYPTTTREGGIWEAEAVMEIIEGSPYEGT